MKAVILLALAAILSSCTLSMNADGSKAVTLDAATAATVIRVISEK